MDFNDNSRFKCVLDHYGWGLQAGLVHELVRERGLAGAVKFLEDREEPIAQVSTVAQASTDQESAADQASTVAERGPAAKERRTNLSGFREHIEWMEAFGTTPPAPGKSGDGKRGRPAFGKNKRKVFNFPGEEPFHVVKAKARKGK